MKEKCFSVFLPGWSLEIHLKYKCVINNAALNGVIWTLSGLFVDLLRLSYMFNHIPSRLHTLCGHSMLCFVMCSVFQQTLLESSVPLCLSSGISSGALLRKQFFGELNYRFIFENGCLKKKKKKIEICNIFLLFLKNNVSEHNFSLMLLFFTIINWCYYWSDYYYYLFILGGSNFNQAL